VFMMPDEPVVGEDLYEMAKEEAKAVVGERTTRCPSCGANMKPGAVLCIGCGYNVQTGEAVVTAIIAPAVGAAAEAPMEKPVGGIYANAMAAGKRKTQFQSSIDPKKEKLKNVYIPIGIIAVSMLVLFIHLVFLAETTIGAFSAIAAISIMTAVVTPILLIGLYIASSVIGVSYGTLPTGLLKLVAIYLAPTAFESLLGAAIGPTGIFGWIISLIFYFSLVMYLFELDPNETFYTIIILAITKFIAVIFLYTAIFSLMFSGITGF